MGNKQSDKEEKKQYQIIKTIPIVGHAYSYARAFVYLHKKDSVEFKHSLDGLFKLDLLTITHPEYGRKTLADIKDAINSAKNDQDVGIWIGKRPIGGDFNPISISVPGGVDANHWAAMINGVVYHVQGKVTKINIDITTSEKIKNSFTWTHKGGEVRKTQSKFSNFCRDFEDKWAKKYSLFALHKDKDKINCQTFVTDLLMFNQQEDD